MYCQYLWIQRKITCFKSASKKISSTNCRLHRMNCLCGHSEDFLIQFHIVFAGFSFQRVTWHGIKDHHTNQKLSWHTFYLNRANLTDAMSEKTTTLFSVSFFFCLVFFSSSSTFFRKLWKAQMQRRVVDLQKVTEERRALYPDKSEVKRQITCKKPCREEGYFTCTKLRWKGKSLAEIIEGGRTLVQNWGNAVDSGLPAAIHSERKDQSYQRCAWHRQETSSLSSTLEVCKSKQNNTH